MAKAYVLCMRTWDGDVIHGVFSDRAKAESAATDARIEGYPNSIIEFDLDEVGPGEETDWEPTRGGPAPMSAE